MDPDSIATPTGLKIRVEASWAFALLLRLKNKDPRTDAYRVLKTTEAIEYIPSLLATMVALGFIYGYSPWAIPVGMVMGRILGLGLTLTGSFDTIRPLGLLALGEVWCRIPWIFHPAVHLLIAGVLFASHGWLATGIWIGSLALAWIAAHITEFVFLFFLRSKSGQPFPGTSSEVNFFNAYRLHADRLGLTRDITVSETEVAAAMYIEELKSEDWRVRQDTAESLGQIGSPESVPALIEALRRDEVEGVRYQAAAALGLIGTPVALAALVEALRNDESGDVRGRAAEALGQIKDPTAVSVLSDTLHMDSDRRVRAEAFTALKLIGTPDAMEIVDSQEQE